MAKELDIILFGATGITGKNAIPILMKLCTAKNRNLTWAIAGRSKTKLKEVLNECERKLGMSLSAIPIIEANIDDESSLLNMAQKARLIINCVGPFHLYGEPVIKACLQEGTHHIDISGEPQYMEAITKYHTEAKNKGLYIISACGFESIIPELCVIFLKNKFDGVLNSVETYMELKMKKTGLKSLNIGTWASLVHFIGDLGQASKLLFSGNVRVLPQRNEFGRGWVVPFPASDRIVMTNSQKCFRCENNERPVEIETFIVAPSFWVLVQLLWFGALIAIFASFRCGKKLLLDHPGFFSKGYVTKSDPDEEETNNTFFTITARAKGWEEKVSSVDDQELTEANKTMLMTVKGRNPGYETTNFCVVLAAIKILMEKEKMPGTGGVLPPGFAFAKTSIMEELHDNDVKFKLL